MPAMKHYRKQLARDGEFFDETGRTIKLSPNAIRQAADGSNHAIGSGIRIPVVTGDQHPVDIHESTPGLDQNPAVKGYLDLLGVQDGWLLGDIKAAEELPDTDVSIWIDPQHTVQGIPCPIRHVLLTDDPAVKGQAPFALLREPKAKDRGPRCSVLCPSILLQEQNMSDTLAAKLRQKLGLSADAADDAVLAELEKKSAPPALPALLSGVRTKLGLAADSKDEDVLGKIEELAKAAKPPANDELPPTMLQAQREIASDRLQIARERFHDSVNELASPNAMKITPAVRERLLKKFPCQAASVGALLAEPKYDDASVRQLILDVLGDLPAKNVTGSGARVVVGGGQLSAGDDVAKRAKEETEKTLAAAGLSPAK